MKKFTNTQSTIRPHKALDYEKELNRIERAMIHSQVWFTVEKDANNVTPPFKEGHIDSFWVKTRKDDTKDIIEAAKDKALKCFGITITDIEAPDGNRFEKEP